MKNFTSLFFFLLVAVLVDGTAFAQPSDCPGWRNPTSFVTGNAQYKYSGKVISSNSTHGTEIGVGPSHYTNVTEIAANALATTVTQSGCSDANAQDGSKRFAIKGSGRDPHTNNQISFLPPYQDHNGQPFTHSIRVGPECTHGSQVLYYQMYVQPSNSLLTLWYAPVVQTPTSHDQYENSALILRVSVLENNQWRLANTSFEYIVSGQPQTSSFPQGLVDGQNGWHHIDAGGYDDIWYKDWTKAMISLDQYLYNTIRVEVYMSACVYDAHYAYCYIAGDYQPMEVTSSGCPAGSSTVVDTLRAPQNMQSYRWYKTTTGFDATGNVYKLKFLDSLSNGIIRTTLTTTTGIDTIRWTPVSALSSDRQYLVQASDFVPTEGPRMGETVGVQSFMCKMMSYIDPAKPFASYVYLPVENNKPQLAIDTVLSCSGTTRLMNRSVSPNRGLDHDKTKWFIYENPDGSGSPLQTLYGDTVDFVSSHAGTYFAKLWSCTDDDSTCYTDHVFAIRTLEDPDAKIGVIPTDEPCLGTEITLVDSTFLGAHPSTQYPGWQRFWQVGGETVTGDAANPQQNYNHAFTEQETVTLITRNGLRYNDRVQASQTVWCADTTERVIKVFTSPNLTVSDDTIVCKGSQTQVTVSADYSGTLDYEWHNKLNDPSDPVISTGNVLRVTPPDEVDAKTYFVKVTRQPQGCSAWDSVTVHIIKPTIHASTETICEDDTVVLWGQNAHHYSWSAGPGDPSLAGQEQQQRITVTPQVTTTYTLVGHGSDDCDAAPLTKVIKVLPFPQPAVSLSPSFIDSENPTVQFSDVSPNHVASVWTFDGASVLGSDVSHTFEDLNRDSVLVSLITSNSLGCSSDTAFFVSVQRFSTWFPNAFTPNKMENNVFRLYTINQLEYFSIYIYSRGGALVFSSDDQNFVWDGTVNDTDCPQGVYTYICRYRRPGTTDILLRKGTIALIR